MDKDLGEKLQTEEARLLRIIEALQTIEASKEWSSLKTEVFGTLVSTLERNLKDESRKEDPDPKKLNRLSGELKWADRYSDLGKLENLYRVQLQNVRLQLHGKKSE